MPGHQWDVDAGIRSIRSCVIVCNHRSYLDPILLISMFKKHTTIVKSRLFDIPVFGKMLEWSGYIPSSTNGRLADIMIRQMEKMPAFLSTGGNLIIFPEGTRRVGEDTGPFNKGAFKIARNCNTPLVVLRIRNTEKMYPPGRFAFNARGPNTIHVEMVGRIEMSGRYKVCELIRQVRGIMDNRLNL